MEHVNLMAQMMGGEGPVAPLSNGSALNIHCTNADAALYTLTSGGNSVASVVANTFWQNYTGAAYNAANAAVFQKATAAFVPPAGRSVISLGINIDKLEKLSEGTGVIQFIIGLVGGSSQLNLTIYDDVIQIIDNSNVRQTYALPIAFPYGDLIITQDVDLATTIGDTWLNNTLVAEGKECGDPVGTSGRFTMASVNRRVTGYTPETHKLDWAKIGDGVAP